MLVCSYSIINHDFIHLSMAHASGLVPKSQMECQGNICTVLLYPAAKPDHAAVRTKSLAISWAVMNLKLLPSPKPQNMPKTKQLAASVGRTISRLYLLCVLTHCCTSAVGHPLGATWRWEFGLGNWPRIACIEPELIHMRPGDWSQERQCLVW